MSKIKMLLLGTLLIIAACLTSCDRFTDKPVQENSSTVSNIAEEDNEIVESIVPTTRETVVEENDVISPSDEPLWLDAYSAVLNGDNELETDFMDLHVIDEVKISNTQVYRGCGLYDIDGDGAPELFVKIGLWEGHYYHLFACENNTGKYVGMIYAGAIEKSKGILINACDDAGYSPDIAYTYKNSAIEELPGYVESIYELDDNNNRIARVRLGDNLYDWFSDEIVHIEMVPTLEEANAGFK